MEVLKYEFSKRYTMGARADVRRKGISTRRTITPPITSTAMIHIQMLMTRRCRPTMLPLWKTVNRFARMWRMTPFNRADETFYIDMGDAE